MDFLSPSDLPNIKKWGTIWLIVFLLTMAGHIIVSIVKDRQVPQEYTLNRFQSDFDDSHKSGDFSSDHVGRKIKFVGYANYVFLRQGEYRFEFRMDLPASDSGHYQLQLASDKGKETLFSKSVPVSPETSVQSFQITLREPVEVEPRVQYIKGSENIRLGEVRIFRVSSYLSWGRMFFSAIVISFLLYFLLMAIYDAGQNNFRWRYSFALFLLLMGMIFIIRQSWVSEDAFITLRHVENFLGGHGPVFNVGERVEGFTHALWFFIVSFFRYLGLGPQGSVLLPAYFFCFGFLYILFFKMNFSDEKNSPPLFNMGGGILIGVSAFIDFGTSGLETSLSYLLLGWYAWMFASGRWKISPLWMGFNVTLLTLTRPDFGVFFLFVLIFYVYNILKKQLSWPVLVRFLLFPVIMLGGYQLFRMGYYASFFPNPYYAKSGGASHLAQGIIYFIDFCRGSLFIPILVLTVLAVMISFKHKQGEWAGRMMIFFSAILYGFFVVRGGGDFMHGRFLLPTLVLITISGVGLFDRLIDSRRITRIFGIVSVVGLIFVSQLVTPVQKRIGANAAGHHGITDERNFYFGNHRIPLKSLFKDHYIIMWKTMGENYFHLSREARQKIRIAYPVIGFLGYYSGKYVQVLDKLGLTDGIVSRQKIKHRGRPGHEKKAPFGYLVYRRLTFGETPFERWNKAAETPYGILWDVSPSTLNKFSFFLNSSFKSNLDKNIHNFLLDLDQDTVNEHADFLFFLKNFWVKYAPAEGKDLFRNIYDKKVIEALSRSFQWIEKNRKMIEELDSRIRGKLTFKKFLSNIFFSLGFK